MKTYLARVACLGQWALNNLRLNNNRKTIYNQQKTRVDMYLDVASGKLNRTKARVALSHIKRIDIENAILSQEDMHWLTIESPEAIIMDSFAELTDQLFIHKAEHWAFCGNGSDINRTDLFTQTFLQKGFLDTNHMYEKYNEFFNLIRKKHDCPIAFMHFPVILDKRRVPKKRYDAIYDAISQIKNEYGILSIEVDDDAVEPRVNSHEAIISSPYHFSNATIKCFSDQIKQDGRIR